MRAIRLLHLLSFLSHGVSALNASGTDCGGKTAFAQPQKPLKLLAGVLLTLCSAGTVGMALSSVPHRSHSTLRLPVRLARRPTRSPDASLRLLDIDALEELDTTDKVVLHDFIGPKEVQALLQDHTALRAMRAGTLGEVEYGALQSHRNGVEQIWLNRNGALPQRHDCGVGAFLSTQFVPTLLNGLQSVPPIRNGGRELPQFLAEVEFAYLHYRSGGFYRPHVDTPDSQGAQGHRRAFSFILFLNSLSESEGGVLRLFPAIPNDVQHQRSARHGQGIDAAFASSPVIDIRPKAGTLVIFRSEALPHEVLETLAPRNALVGWLHRKYVN